MVSMDDVERAQKAWGDGIVEIAKTHLDGGDFVSASKKHIRNFTHMNLEQSCSNLRSHRLNNFDKRLTLHYPTFPHQTEHALRTRLDAPFPAAKAPVEATPAPTALNDAVFKNFLLLTFDLSMMLIISNPEKYENLYLE